VAGALDSAQAPTSSRGKRGGCTTAIGDRLLAWQVDEGLPVYVTALRPIERVIAQLREREAAGPLVALPLA
jgi:hypothetical protein